MLDVAAVLVDLLVEMPTALRIQEEPADTLGRITQESAQGDTVFALATELGFAFPVLGRLDGVCRGSTQFREAMLQEPRSGSTPNGRRHRLRVKSPHVGNEYGTKIIMTSVR